tara:strand:+ start:783 stop:953 length:171 start_codon:yes stop_codon:yes gene_type:complete
MPNKNQEKEQAMNRIYKHLGSATISLAELDEYERLIRRQIVRGRTARRRRMKQWTH